MRDYVNSTSVQLVEVRVKKQKFSMTFGQVKIRQAFLAFGDVWFIKTSSRAAVSCLNFVEMGFHDHDGVLDIGTPVVLIE